MKHINKLVIVTGGSGFIGINLSLRLLDLGYKVINLDIKKPKNKILNKYFIFCDITNLNDLKNIIENYKPDYLVNLAARTDLKGKHIKEYAVNTVGTENICISSINSQSIKKVLFASTMLVCKVGHIPLNNQEYSADTIYGKSKVKGELVVKKYSDKLPAHFIFRPTSIWGPWFQKPYRDFFDLLLAGRYFKIGKFSCTKTFGYIENSVNQIISLMEYEKEIEINTPIYIGDCVPINIDKWADQIANIAGIRKPISIPFFFIMLGGFFGDILNLFKINFPLNSFRVKNMTTNNIIPSVLMKELTKYPKISVEDGIKSTLRWINNSGN